jgi:hypothetical protein
MFNKNILPKCFYNTFKINCLNFQMPETVFTYKYNRVVENKTQQKKLSNLKLIQYVLLNVITLGKANLIIINNYNVLNGRL